MKIPSQPSWFDQSTPPTLTFLPCLDPNTFDLDDAEEVVSLVKELINGRHPGLLQTVGLEGFPRSRWMATLSAEAFPLFHTLTAPGSRKTKEIQNNPLVSWMFFNQDLSLIVSMSGKARVLKDTRTLKRVWKQVQDKSLAYFLKNYNEGPGFVVIETTIESLECNSPKNALRFSVNLDEIRRQS